MAPPKGTIFICPIKDNSSPTLFALIKRGFWYHRHIMKRSILLASACIAVILGFIIGVSTKCINTDHKDVAGGISTENTAEPLTEESLVSSREEETKAPAPHLIEIFDTAKAMEHIRMLSSGIGIRVQGTEGDRRAAEYIREAFRQGGYAEVVTQTVPLPNGGTTSNIYVDSPGSGDGFTIIIGAHYDTIGGTGSPGANDNASGVGVVLELARVFRTNPHYPNLRFVAFGAEEVTPGLGRNDHHHGSRYMAARLGQEPDKNFIGAISVDMVGVGNRLLLNSTLKTPKSLLDLFFAYCKGQGIIPEFRQDKEWSDHEAFEGHGISSFWMEFYNDPNYHTTADTIDKIEPSLIERSGLLLQGFLESLDHEACRQLDAVSEYR